MDWNVREPGAAARAGLFKDRADSMSGLASTAALDHGQLAGAPGVLPGQSSGEASVEASSPGR